MWRSVSHDRYLVRIAYIYKWSISLQYRKGVFFFLFVLFCFGTVRTNERKYLLLFSSLVYNFITVFFLLLVPTFTVYRFHKFV